MKDQIAKIFSHLDRWRHLPNYQLERRIDVFFSIYLKPLVEEYEARPLLDIIIPELPIKIGGSGRSFKVDYVLFSKDKSVAYFIELKTDGGSRRDEQDEYLRNAAKAGMQRILEDLKEITLRTTSYRKYWHLLHWLAKAEVIKVSGDVRSFLYPEIRPGLRAGLASVEVIAKAMEIRVIYIQPCRKTAMGDGPIERCIDFDDIIKHLMNYDDEFSKVFTEHLIRWKGQAGECEPT